MTNAIETRIIRKPKSWLSRMGLSVSLPAICLTSLSCSFMGCGAEPASTAHNVLNTEESIFSDVDLKDLVANRDTGTTNIENMQLDLDLLSPQHFLAVVVDGKQLQSYFQSRDIGIDQQLLEPKPADVSLEDLSMLLFMLDDSMLQNAMGGTVEKGWAIQLNFEKPVNTSAWENWLMGPTASQKPIGDGTAQMLADDSFGLMWLNETKAVLGSKDELVAIRKRINQPMTTQMSTRIRQQYDGDFVYLSMQAAPLRKLVESAEQMMASFGQNDERLNKLFAGARALDDVQFRANLTGDQLGNLRLSFADEEAASSIQSIVNDGINQMANFVGSSNSRPDGPPGNPAAGISAELRNLLEEIQKDLANGGLESKQEENQVVINLDRPSRFDELIDQSLEGWQTAKSMMYRSRKAAALALAIHQFENKHGRLPANAASPRLYETDNLAEDLPSFSWRVALLPFMGHQELYDSFDFSEPWDSETNLKAASKMPAVYSWKDLPETGQTDWVDGEDSVPESDFHMLTGKSGGAGEAQVFDPNEVKDNPDRTILIHQTPHLSSAWSKPDDGWQVSDVNDKASLGTERDNPVLAILYSGRVIAVTPELSPEDWFGWVTPAGGEKVNRNLFKQVTVFAPMKD